MAFDYANGAKQATLTKIDKINQGNIGYTGEIDPEIDKLFSGL